jgi:mannose-6-phosphate isomerase-like protein (cupin superfamily)
VKEIAVSLGGGYMLPSRDGTQIPAIGLGITMKTDGKSTHDAYSLFEYTVPPETNGPPLHLHTREDESFIVLAGRLDVTLGDHEYVLQFGDYLYLPRNVVHTFRNPYDEESRIASVVSPAGLERYYQALGELPPGPKDLSLIKAIMDDFGIEMQLPPAGH